MTESHSFTTDPLKDFLRHAVLDCIEGDCPVPCNACDDGEHSECERPTKTQEERDTGYWYVTRCCCVPDDWDEP